MRVSVQSMSRRLMPIPTVEPMNALTVIADPSLLTNLVTIGCKAEGRPKARIRWFEQQSDGQRGPVDFSSPLRSETVPRQGQSFLHVVIGSNSTFCTTFTCEAENGGGVVSGEIEICPQREFYKSRLLIFASGWLIT